MCEIKQLLVVMSLGPREHKNNGMFRGHGIVEGKTKLSLRAPKVHILKGPPGGWAVTDTFIVREEFKARYLLQ